jgi:hypothetical protein
VDGLKITGVMMMSIESMKQALEALESATPKYTRQRADQKTLGGALDYWKLEQHQRLKAIKFLRQAIADAEEQEPVGIQLPILALDGVALSSSVVEQIMEWGKKCANHQQTKEEKQEPVAWMYDWTSHDGEFIQDWTTSDAETLRYTEPTIISNVRPLYLHPDKTQRCYCGDIYRLGVVHRENSFCDEHPQPKREPLTDDEIWKNDDIMAANSGYGANFETLREVIRAVEAAHGIKENT